MLNASIDLALNHDYSARQVTFTPEEFAPFPPSKTKKLCSVTGTNPFVVVLGVPVAGFSVVRIIFCGDNGNGGTPNGEFRR